MCVGRLGSCTCRDVSVKTGFTLTRYLDRDPLTISSRGAIGLRVAVKEFCEKGEAWRQSVLDMKDCRQRVGVEDITDCRHEKGPPHLTRCEVNNTVSEQPVLGATSSSRLAESPHCLLQFDLSASTCGRY
ncbi:hypothetical protein RRG08_067067 [Elysia crispata]|uniref:Uncharacterized protein n=1 Tax=Elysia crispata TaxID=231223 RepID=A0AAE1B7K0_9GAST|nr:hypothetical protein RRG08_067067 [Elysia crispata]